MTKKFSPGFKTRPQLLASQEVGCFHCLQRFTPKSIKEWIDDKQTALCPHCGVDSVIARNPNDSAHEFKARLEKLKSDRFGGMTDVLS